MIWDGIVSCMDTELIPTGALFCTPVSLPLLYGHVDVNNASRDALLSGDAFASSSITERMP